MRSRTATWFECRIRYEKTMEDGMQKKVTENYVVDALSFSEAEERITEEMSVYVSGEFDIVDIKIAPYAEVFFADSDAADKWYKAKLAFITLDEKTQKEKRSAVNYLVNAGSLNGSVKAIDEIMSQSMVDYSTVSVNETTLLDVFEYKKKEKDDKPEYEQQYTLRKGKRDVGLRRKCKHPGGDAPDAAYGEARGRQQIPSQRISSGCLR